MPWFHDGCESYKDPYLGAVSFISSLTVWDSAVFGSGLGGGSQLQTTAGRFGGQALKLVINGGHVAYLSKLVPNWQSGNIQFSFKPGEPANQFHIIDFVETSTIQCAIACDTSNRLRAIDANGVVIGQTQPLASTWHDVAIKFGISQTGGVLQIRVDNMIALTLTGQDTKASSNSYITEIRAGCPSGAFDATLGTFDDFIIDPDEFFGTVYVAGSVPNADGSVANWSRTGTNTGHNYSQVSEVGPDDDTTTIDDSTATDVDRYGFAPLTQTGKIISVGHWMRAKKTDGATRKIRTSLKSGSTVSDNGSDLTLSSSYAPYLGEFEEDPATNKLWAAIAAVNAAEAGPLVIS